MNPALGPSFTDALGYAAQVHAGHERKGSEIPYISHLLAVCALVIEDRGDETEAIAALLHDAPEDRGGRERLEEIRRRFGDDVARIVEACSDTLETPKPPWRERKEAYIEHMRTAPPPVLRVSNADKLHNARAILADYREDGEELWSRFTGKREGTLWYYRTLTEVFTERAPGQMADELKRVVEQLPR